MGLSFEILRFGIGVSDSNWDLEIENSEVGGEGGGRSRGKDGEVGSQLKNIQMGNIW